MDKDGIRDPGIWGRGKEDFPFSAANLSKHDAQNRTWMVRVKGFDKQISAKVCAQF